MTCIGNAGEAVCRSELVVDERKRRIGMIIDASFEEVEGDKGKWEILDDMYLQLPQNK